MASLEEQFEQAFTEIMVPGGDKHLLEAEAVTECVVSGETVLIGLNLPKDAELRRKVAAQVKERIQRIDGISGVTVRMADEPTQQSGPPPGHDHAGHDHAGHDHAGHDHAGHQHGAPGGSQPRAPQRPENKTYLSNYDAVVVVGSGKGGVGKSTVAVNLAVALYKMGHKVSLFDADIYGPSLPIMMGLRNNKPSLHPDNTIIPLQKYGLDVLSIGNLIEEAAATIWRGPIVHQVLEQLLRDTKWPGGDFMIIDLPPGTGDAQLTLTQLLAISGAVIVSTPQDVALIDAIKAVSMFQKVDVPVLGIVENMSAFICPSCHTETAIFDKGNAEKAGHQNNLPFLGRIPIEMGIRQGGDLGTPITQSHPEGASSMAFKGIAEQVIANLEKIG